MSSEAAIIDLTQHKPGSTGLPLLVAACCILGCGPHSKVDRPDTDAPQSRARAQQPPTEGKETTAPRSAIPATSSVVDDRFRLDIAPRSHAPESPSAGWCGETAIQEALLYHGAFFPQRMINRAGKPQNPDLYSHDIPVALKNLGVDFEPYPWRVRGFDRFMGWLKTQIKAGAPVFLGMKIYPTKHPKWGLDHFVLAVGFGDDHLLVNTTWGSSQERSYAQLQSTAKGLSLKNRYGTYYAYRVASFAGRSLKHPVRLYVTSENDDRADITIMSEGLTAGTSYRVARYDGLDSGEPTRTFTFAATGPTHALSDVIDKDRPAIYRCAARP